MSQLLTEKSVRRVISHREGALLRGLMFPGPFQFFHPGTHRQKQTFNRRLSEEEPSQKSPDDQEAELWRNKITVMVSHVQTADYIEGVKKAKLCVMKCNSHYPAKHIYMEKQITTNLN